MSVLETATPLMMGVHSRGNAPGVLVDRGWSLAAQATGPSDLRGWPAGRGADRAAFASREERLRRRWDEEACAPPRMQATLGTPEILLSVMPLAGGKRPPLASPAQR